MEDVVGVKARDSRGRRVAFITWGRVLGVVDPSDLLRAVKRASASCVGSPMSKFELCSSLIDVSGHEYFFEALLAFAWRPIPFGPRYNAWKSKKRRELLNGDEIYFLGGRKAKKR